MYHYVYVDESGDFRSSAKACIFGVFLEGDNGRDSFSNAFTKKVREEATKANIPQRKMHAIELKREGHLESLQNLQNLILESVQNNQLKVGGITTKNIDATQDHYVPMLHQFVVESIRYFARQGCIANRYRFVFADRFESIRMYGLKNNVKEILGEVAKEDPFLTIIQRCHFCNAPAIESELLAAADILNNSIFGYLADRPFVVGKQLFGKNILSGKYQKSKYKKYSTTHSKSSHTENSLFLETRKLVSKGQYSETATKILSAMTQNGESLQIDRLTEVIEMALSSGSSATDKVADVLISELRRCDESRNLARVGPLFRFIEPPNPLLEHLQLKNKLEIIKVCMDVRNHMGLSHLPDYFSLFELDLFPKARKNADCQYLALDIFNIAGVRCQNSFDFDQAETRVGKHIDSWRKAGKGVWGGEQKIWSRGAIMGTMGQNYCFMGHINRDLDSIELGMMELTESRKDFDQPGDLDRNTVYQVHAEISRWFVLRQQKTPAIERIKPLQRAGELLCNLTFPIRLDGGNLLNDLLSHVEGAQVRYAHDYELHAALKLIYARKIENGLPEMMLDWNKIVGPLGQNNRIYQHPSELNFFYLLKLGGDRMECAGKVSRFLSYSEFAPVLIGHVLCLSAGLLGPKKNVAEAFAREENPSSYLLRLKDQIEHADEKAEDLCFYLPFNYS